MMGEKRFIIVKSIENLYALVDKERDDKEQILIFSLDKEKLDVVCGLLNEQETRIDLLEKGILDCLFEDKSIGMFALDMRLVE